uniref:Uncharacterized protein n=1 Tax=Parascaris univalens TaxID=6257 RepID=A0A915A7Z5_PARUN
LLHSVCSLSSGRLLEMTGIIGLLVALVIIGTSFYIYRHYVLFPPAKIPERDEIIDPLASTVTANPLHSTTDANATAKPPTGKGSTESSEEANGISGSKTNTQTAEGKKKRRKQKRTKKSHTSKDEKKKRSKKRKSKREKKLKKDSEEGEKLEKSTEKRPLLINALT